MADALDLDSLTRNHARARRLARALVRSDDEADDLVQDAWVRAIERGPRDPGALGGWLATVVRRLAVNARRGGGRRRDREEEAARHEALPSSADIAARVEVEARLLRALESLAEPHRTVLRDRYLGGLEPAQMAERDGLSHEAVRSRLKRARAAMRAQLDREGLGSEQHWTLAVGPLLVPSAGTTLASGGAAATGVAGLTTLFGGELMIKKLVAVGIAVAAIGVAVWQNTGRDEVRRTALPEPQQVERLAGVEEARGPFAQAEQDARLATPDTPGQVRSRGERPDARPDEGDPWRVAGRFRTAGEDRGVAGVEFVLTMYAGMDAEGDAMGRYDLTSDADGRFAVDLERPQRSVCFDLELPPHPDREYSVDAPWRAPLGGDAPQIDILTLVRNATVEGVVLGADGRPVGGAQIEGKCGRAETGADGTFRMEVCARAYGDVTARKAGHGHARAHVGGLEAGGTARVEMQLPPEAVVRGVVVDARGGPIAGAEVHAGNDMQWKVTTDSGGRYELRSLHFKPNENLRVSATTRLHASVTRDVRFLDGQTAYEVDFELARGTRVTGSVREPDGTPVIGAEVWSGFDVWAWDRVATFTGDDGRFALDGVALGLTRMGVRAGGWPTVDRRVEVRGADVVDFTLDEPRIVRGIVRDERGLPIAGVGVYGKVADRYLPDQVRTDEQGRFEVDGFPSEGRLAVEAFGPGWIPSEASLDAVDFEGDGIVLVLAPSGVLRGRVIDAATGTPIPSFTIRIGWPQWPDGMPEGSEPIHGVTASWNEPGRTFEDESGRWSTSENDDLPPGHWAMVEASAPGYASLRLDAVQVSPATEETEIELALVRPIDLEVTVTCGDEPMERARVVATASEYSFASDPEWTATTGAAGVALLESAPSGRLFVRVHRDHRPTWEAGWFDVSTATPSIAIEIPAGQPVSVVVRARSGEPLAQDRVLLEPLGVEYSQQKRTFARTDAQGRVTFQGVTPGQWRVARAPGDEQHVRPDLPTTVIVTGDREPDPVLLQPKGEALVTVSFTGDLTPPAGTLIRLEQDGEILRSSPVIGSEATFDGVEVGSYAVRSWWWSSGIGKLVDVEGELEVADGEQHSVAVARTEARED